MLAFNCDKRLFNFYLSSLEIELIVGVGRIKLSNSEKENATKILKVKTMRHFV